MRTRTPMRRCLHDFTYSLNSVTLASASPECPVYGIGRSSAAGSTDHQGSLTENTVSLCMPSSPDLTQLDTVWLIENEFCIMESHRRVCVCSKGLGDDKANLVDPTKPVPAAAA